MINEVFEQRNTLLYPAELQRQIFFDNLSDKQAAPVGLEPTTTGWEPCTPLRQSIMFRLLIRGAAC